MENGEEVLEMLKHGIPMQIPHEEMEEKVKQNFKEHTCFRSPVAVYNWTVETLKEMKKGFILGPFDAKSKN